MDSIDSALRSLHPLATRVAQVHGAHNPKLIALQHAFVELCDVVECAGSPREILARIRDLADGFVAPDWACRSYRALLSGLETLEGDLLRK